MGLKMTMSHEDFKKLIAPGAMAMFLEDKEKLKAIKETTKHQKQMIKSLNKFLDSLDLLIKALRNEYPQDSNDEIGERLNLILERCVVFSEPDPSKISVCLEIREK